MKSSRVAQTGFCMKVVIPYKPRYPQVHKILREKRFCVLAAHRRFGKTVLAVNHLIMSAVACARTAGHFGYVAPFRNQAKSVAWDYLKRYCRPLPGMKINESELSISLPSAGGGAKIRIFGADKPDSLRGLYFDGIVLDEVAQMKAEVWEEIVQPALADRRGFALFIGTPKGVNLFSRLYYHALREEKSGGSDWVAMTFPCDQTNALPREELERLRAELSENKFRQEMCCDFTASGDDSLISLDEVNAALGRRADREAAAQWPLVIGVDIARFGEDSSVFFPRRGLMASQPLVLRKRSNTDVAQRLLALIHEEKPRMVNIDQGNGTGVIDMVRDMAPAGVTVNEVPFGSRALQEKRYFNRRAEIWCNLRDWLKAGGCLEVDNATARILQAELSSPLYSFDAQGRVRLEAKDEIKKRLSHSTDLGDALALSFAMPLAPEGLIQPRQKRKKVYDPFAS